jgi:tetratricopeptide (TPR) repeat protein
LKRKIGIIVALAGAALLIVLLYKAPITPASEVVVEPESHSISDGHSELEHKLEEAIAKVNGGEPMAGITMLRDLAAEYPNEPLPHFYLGLFSMQSGQFDKAVERFEKVIVLDPKLLSAYTYLAEANLALGNQDRAVEILEALYLQLENEQEKAELFQYIEEVKTLNKKSTNE